MSEAVAHAAIERIFREEPTGAAIGLGRVLRSRCQACPRSPACSP